MDDATLASILEHARSASGVDFSRYRRTTVLRRVEHRVRMCGAEPNAYLALLERDPGERWRLVDALLIKTTFAFRDLPTSRAVQRAIPNLLARCVRRGCGALRVWCCGCSSGEEAYALAACLLEGVEQAQVELSIEVLATDVDGAALEQTARGLYRAESLARLPQPLADRYFDRRGSSWVANERLRRCVTAARHDLLDSARLPSGLFASFDVVSCCNVLLYFTEEARAQALQRLIEACEPGGVLVLGEAERPNSALASRLRVLEAGTHAFEVSST